MIDISKIMQDRGYELHHHSSGFHDCYIKKTEDGILLAAYVFTDSQEIELVYTGLKLYMRITSGKLPINHPNFKRHEDIVLFYAKLCSQNNPFNLGL